jgi:hypothetical protein
MVANHSAEAAWVSARQPILRNAAKSERLPTVTFNDEKHARA